MAPSVIVTIHADPTDRGLRTAGAVGAANTPYLLSTEPQRRRKHYILGRGTVRALLVLGISIYVLMFVQRHNLPDKLQKDSIKLMEMARGEIDTKGSFGATASILAGIPDPVLDAFVFIVGVSTITAFVMRLRSLIGCVTLAFILGPMVLFCLLFPLKDNFVVLMTLSIALVSERIRSRFSLLLIIVVTYALYGYYIRIYYLIIVALFALSCVLITRRPVTKIVILAALLGSSVLLPPTLFRVLQEPRDTRMGAANHSTEDLHRTAFGNLLPPDNLKNFICNYAYAATVLNVPVVAFPTVKSLVLMATIIVVLFLCVAGIRAQQHDVHTLTCLFIAHPLVLILFDGDLGSYYRHMVSACALLLPAFTMAESGRDERSA